ncbi:hypothetical protein A4G99_04195 [Haladaptatus sp. R4]|uniref:restriction endonuclease n=1 Tax=Haladaptatus sp. R4 TaxID=1679489 RepID=UPI0007B47D03|nr:restriction endonuclease [Haladaptatus sp. R4]KZN25664.1 hypothetical protein A4G99_04195 [Haladaptatus sp. R4]
MIRQIPQSAFPDFVATLWRKQGWTTTVKEKAEKTFVALQREGAEGLIWATPRTGDGVSGKELQQFVKICKQYGVNEGAVVTPGTFTEDAEKIGSQAGIQLVDGEKLRTIVEARELHDLVEQFADGDATGADESGDTDGIGPLPISLPNSLPIPDAVSRKMVAAVVVAVLAIALAAVVAPTILGTGGHVATDDGWNVSANSTATPNAANALEVRWNAKRVPKVDPKTGDDGVYKARDGKQFLLVSMNVTNDGDDTVGLQSQDFAVRSNGSLLGAQALTNTTGHSGVLESGDSTTVWYVFSIDEDAPSATIVTSGRMRRSNVPVRFVRDKSVEANV